MCIITSFSSWHRILSCLQVKQLLHIFLEVEIKLIPILAGACSTIDRVATGIIASCIFPLAMSIQGLKVNCSKLVYYEEVLKVRLIANS